MLVYENFIVWDMVSTIVETGIEDYYVNEWQEMYKSKCVEGHTRICYIRMPQVLNIKPQQHNKSTYHKSSRLQFPEMSSLQ